MPHPQQSDTTTVDIRSLRRRISRWQSTRVGQARMPEELWNEALSLAEEVGPYRAAIDLGLSYPTLKRRLEARHADAVASPEVPAFVEWITPVVGGTVAECVLEVESRGGTRLRLEMKGVPPQGLAAILRELVA
jgi:hypothetical protein